MCVIISLPTRPLQLQLRPSRGLMRKRGTDEFSLNAPREQIAGFRMPCLAASFLALIFWSFLWSYTARAGCIAPPSELVAWWPMQSNAVDVVGGHNGTLAGTYSF